MKTFILKEEHIKLLSNSYVAWNQGYSEFGAPCIDSKRPYGNSDIIGDIYQILEGKRLDENELEKQGIDYCDFCDKLYEDYKKLHEETETALQIILHTKDFQIGTYRSSRYGKDWVKIK